MHSKCRFVVQLMICLASAAGMARAGETLDLSRITGATIPEERVTAILHVDNVNDAASDENPGTEAQPLLTLGRATALANANNRKNIGTRILVHPGTYRECLELPFLGDSTTDAPLVIEATEKGKTIVSGSGRVDKQTGETLGVFSAGTAIGEMIELEARR